MVRKSYYILVVGLFSVMSLGLRAEENGSLERRIRSVVERFVLSIISADSLEVRVDVPNLIRVGVGDTDSLELHTDWKKGRDALAGKVYIPVRVMAKGKILWTTYAATTIRLFDRVCVTNKLMNRHSFFRVEDVHQEMRDVTNLSWPPYKNRETLLGMRIKRAIGKGRIVTTDLVEDPPLIHRGDRVQIMLSYKNITLMDTGFAKEDGWVGDKIRIRHLKSRSEITGRVKSSRVVEIQL